MPSVFVNIDCESLIRYRTATQEQLLTDIDDPDQAEIEDVEDLPELDIDLDTDDYRAPMKPLSPSPATSHTPSPVPYSSLPRHQVAKANKCRKRNLRSHQKRKAERQAAAASAKVQSSVKAVHKRKVAASVPLITSYNVAGPLVWTGRKTPWNRESFSLKDMARLGFRVVHWNGRYVGYTLPTVPAS